MSDGRSATDEVPPKGPIMDFSESNPWWDSIALVLGLGMLFVGSAWHWTSVSTFGGGVAFSYFLGATIAGLRQDLRDGIRAWLARRWWLAFAAIGLVTAAGWLWK